MAQSPSEFSFTLLTGIPLLILICLAGVGLKFLVMKYLEKKQIRPIWIELASDGVALVVMFFAGWATAPLMGYGPNPWFH